MNNPRTSSTPAERDLEAARANRDPVRGAPGSHPVGTGVGAATGAAVGVGVGAVVGGPVGAVLGAAVGAVAGGIGGKAAAEVIDPTIEEAYWRTNYKTRPYVEPNTAFDVYAPAYRFGWENRAKSKDRGSRPFAEIENTLAEEWKKASATTSLAWDKAKLAVRDAWDHIPAVGTQVKATMPGTKAGECCEPTPSAHAVIGQNKPSAPSR